MSVSDVMDFKYKKQFQQDEEISLYESFQRCKMPFKTEDVKAAKQNVELGDHLAVHRALFIIHFICTGIEEDKITLHTVDPVCDACRGIRINCSNLHEVTTREFHTYQEMEEENMFKIIWPDELKSRSRDVQRIISSAKKIIHEIDSELFVTKCIYGVGVKLKVEQPYFYMEDALNTIHVLLKEIHKEKFAKGKAASSQVLQETTDCPRIELTRGTTCGGHSQNESFILVNSEDPFKSFSGLKSILKKSPYDQKSELQSRFGKSLCPYIEILEISDIAEGDHIIFERERMRGLVRYHHSALVAEVVDENNITLIEYSLPDQFKWNMIMMDIAMITTTTKSLKEWKSKGAKKVDWHEKITVHGYKSDEAVSRAIKRLKENDYDLIKNNCDQFVTWCKFGLNVSLQVDEWVIMLRTAFYTAVAALKDPSIDCLIKVLTNISDYIAAFVERSGPALPLIAVLEIMLAFYKTYLRLTRNCKSNVIDDEQLKKEIIEIWSKGSSRVLGSCAVLAVGYSSVCALAVAAGFGHMMSTLYHWLRQDNEIRMKINAEFDRVKKAIHFMKTPDKGSHIEETSDEGFRSEASLQSFQEVFHSDCNDMVKNPDDIPEKYQWLQPMYFLLQSIGAL